MGGRMDPVRVALVHSAAHLHAAMGGVHFRDQRNDIPPDGPVPDDGQDSLLPVVISAECRVLVVL